MQIAGWQWRSKLGPDGWDNAPFSTQDPGELHEQFEKRPLYAEAPVKPKPQHADTCAFWKPRRTLRYRCTCGAE